MKRALIFGITGQDGSFLAKLLLDKGYEVHGVKRRNSLIDTPRLDHLYKERHTYGNNLHLHYGDLTDALNISKIINLVQPDEIYNLAAQSHVHISFDMPEYTANADGLGTLRILESIRLLGLEKKTRYLQAGTSEMFGKVLQTPQNENTPFNPQSPYAISKTFAHYLTINYRDAYGLHASNCISFNHESSVRGQNFVTRKITRSLTAIKYGLQEILWLGNINARRDWGYAEDYVFGQWLMLQQEFPDDYVLSTGIQYSVRDFVNKVADELEMAVSWQGSGLSEVLIWENPSPRYLEFYKSTQPHILKIDEAYFRPSEVESLLGDSTKARTILNWKPTTDFDGLVKIMVSSEISRIRKII